MGAVTTTDARGARELAAQTPLGELDKQVVLSQRKSEAFRKEKSDHTLENTPHQRLSEGHSQAMMDQQ